LAVTESRLRLYVRPWFGERPINKIGPADIRRWQAHLATSTGYPTLMQCRSLVLRILQFAVDEGAIEANPVRKVPAPRRRVDPDQVLNATKRRALTPEEPGRLLAQFPLFWWDHVLCLLGTGLRFGELAGLRRRRVQLNRPLPLLQVVDTRDQAGRFGSGFKPRPKSDAGIRELPLAPLVIEAIHRQLPPGSDPSDLVFTWPGGGPGGPGHAGDPRGTRTVLSRHDLHRTYQTAPAKLADPPASCDPPPPGSADRRPAHHRARCARRAIRSGTVVAALAELEAADWSLAARIAAAIEHGSSGCWRSLSRPFRRSRTAQHTECSRDYGPRCLANLWQPALKAVGEDTLCLVELRGFEPLTPCTPSTSR
jgi:integrase